MSTHAPGPTPWVHFIRRLYPAYVIFHLCGTHYPVTSKTGVGVTNEIHFVLFLVLASLTWEFVRTFSPKMTLFDTLKVGIVLVAFSTFDEVTQAIFGRSPELYDWSLDFAGTTLALAIMYHVRNGERETLPSIQDASSS